MGMVTIEIPFLEYEGTSAKKTMPVTRPISSKQERISIEKQTGATFTPNELARFLSEKILSYTHSFAEQSCIVDPACGDGALLSAIYNVSPKVPSMRFVGFDMNATYLGTAEETLKNIANHTLYQKDFLEVAVTKEYNQYADIIIANPPYVRTQLLGAAKTQELAKTFGLEGRLDLYHAFLVGMTNLLKNGGLLGVITSNRYLTTKSGAPIRKYLLEHYDILEIIDLGDTKLFDAAVLPAIFIGRKKNNIGQVSCPCSFSKTYEYMGDKKESAISVSSVYEIIRSSQSGLFHIPGKGLWYEHSVGLLKHNAAPDSIWQMTSEEENVWIEKVLAHSSFIVKDRFKVRVGIKSCADNVYIKSNWETEKYQPEPALLFTLLSSENITAWNTDLSKCSKVLYPHYASQGKRYVVPLEQYPQTRAYLEQHREQLASRTYLEEAHRLWYEMWVPQNPALFKMPKLVFPDISLEPRFAYDTTGAIVNGNCYWIVAQNPKEEELLYLIEGVANSRLMMKYHDLRFNNKLYSGRRRYLTQYVEKYPMPNPENIYSQKVIEIVKQLNACHDETAKNCLIEDLNANVEKAFGF